MEGFKTSFDAVFLELFGTSSPYSWEEAKERFSQGISLPRQASTAGGELVYTYYPDPSISMEEVRRAESKNGFLFSTAPINSLADVEVLSRQTRLFLGSKSLQSTNVFASDNVIGSSDVHSSSYIFQSKHIGFSSLITQCEYLFGSKNMLSSSFCLRTQDSKLLTNCYEVSWSAKCSNSLFCHNSFDLQDCMFSSHLASKRYCIANRQYSKEEYFKIKKILIEELSKNDFRTSFFPCL